MKLILAAAVAATALSAVPAEARNPRHHMATCARWHHHRCVAWTSMRRVRPMHAARYRVGYVFGPRYHYTTYSAIPQSYVTQYNLAPDGRYVYNNGYVYVVDPKTYAVTQVLNAITH